ncbi:MAG TPA: ABC transporter permease [Mycobacteriales bacterium]|nr:ABC transporter permease [Mycobacteriales bacterium]
MFAYAVKRLLLAIPTLIVSTFVIFLICASFMNPTSFLFGHGQPPPPRVVAFERHKYWLDQALLPRYWHWITGIVVHGRWGPSDQGFNIGHEIFSRLWVTSRLVIAAMVIAAVLAVIVGVISAVKQYSITDYTLSFAGFLFLSLPAFWLAILLKEAGIHLNTSFGHQVFDTIGEQGFGSGAGSFSDILSHLILPTITLALISFASWSRFNRGSMLEVLNSDYIRLARAKGLRNRTVMVRHALRTALIPMITVMALDIAAIFGSAVVTETVYQWHGMGDFLLTSIQKQDQFAVLAWLLVAGFIVILFNLLADLLYAWLDPRIRYD